MKKILLLLFSFIALFTHAQNLRAVADTFTVLQANTDTFVVTRNDTIPAGDSVCITLLDTASRFSVLNCNSIIYHPDSMFTGRDTFRYALCDTSHVCDTAMVVVWVDTNRGLLPVARFVQDSLYSEFGNNILLQCIRGAWPYGAEIYYLSSISMRADSLLWRIRDIDNGWPLYDSVKYFNSDTIIVQPISLWNTYYPNWPGNYYNDTYWPNYVEFCLTAYNNYGANTVCDTTCKLIYEGITEVPLTLSPQISSLLLICGRIASL